MRVSKLLSIRHDAIEVTLVTPFTFYEIYYFDNP